MTRLGVSTVGMATGVWGAGGFGKTTMARLLVQRQEIPHALLSTNPDLLDSKNEPWPGGTQHQLYTVGIEIACVVDVVTSAMPTTAEAKQWELDAGVPLLRVRCISIDTQDRVVDVSDSDFPADRTEPSCAALHP